MTNRFTELFPNNLEEALKQYAELTDKYEDVRLEKVSLSFGHVFYIVRYRYPKQQERSKMERTKPFYQVVYTREDGWDDCECFSTLREAKQFAKNHSECAINRWLDENHEDFSFTPILINFDN